MTFRLVLVQVDDSLAFRNTLDVEYGLVDRASNRETSPVPEKNADIPELWEMFHKAHYV